MVKVFCGGGGAEGEGGASNRAIGRKVRGGERRDMPEVITDWGRRGIGWYFNKFHDGVVDLEELARS